MKSMVVYCHEYINIPNQSTNQACDTISFLFIIFTRSYFSITSVRLFNLLLLSFGIGQYYIRLVCFIRFIQFIQLIQFSCHLIVYSSIASTVTQYLEVEWDLFQPTPHEIRFQPDWVGLCHKIQFYPKNSVQANYYAIL